MDLKTLSAAQGTNPEDPGLSTTELEQLVAQLTIATETNRVIGAAIGIVMERGGLDYHTAYQHLVRRSQTTNTKLRLVAFELVDPNASTPTQ